MQRSNLIVFIVLSALILGGWFWMANSLNTPKELAKVDTRENEDKAKAAKEKAEKARVEKEKAEREKAEKENAEKATAAKEPKNPLVKEAPAETEKHGGEGFHLTVHTISRGAGVRRVPLNRFKAADWQGRPTELPLEIIQDDEYNPSFRMHPYLQPKDENPALGLGEMIRNYEKTTPAKA